MRLRPMRGELARVVDRARALANIPPRIYAVSLCAAAADLIIVTNVWL